MKIVASGVVRWWEVGPYLLSLEGTAVSDDGLAIVAGWEELQFLFLDKTSISDEGLSHIEDLPKLHVLSTYDTQVTDAFRSRLRAKRPDLQVSPTRVTNK
jgi:hypothetical protein